MSYLLFPGRHHLLTQFQYEYLNQVTVDTGNGVVDVEGKSLGDLLPIQSIIWAITSANHSNTRRNPLSANRREVAIEGMGVDLPVESRVYLIDDIGSTPRFAEYVLMKVEVASQGRIQMTPDNTVVGCSTPEVIEMYERLGFRILPFELECRESATWSPDTPWQLMDRIVQTSEQGSDWREAEFFQQQVADATQRLFLKYEFGDLIIGLHDCGLLTDDGDLTETRDYNTYVRSFDRGANRKYELIKDLVLPGRIVDVGCCTGSLIRELTHDDRLRESDFFGIEVARQLHTECVHRKEQGFFGNDHVFFYQKDFTAGPMFAANSVNTFTTFALTHEIESYSDRATLLRFLSLIYDQLAPGGRWLNVDVVGPENKDEQVYLWLNQEDGRDDDYDQEFDPDQREELKEYLEGLSTYGRFLRFARDFRREEGYELKFEEEVVKGKPVLALSMQDGCEFISKKDYTDNWMSEMHERFCFWNFEDWKHAVEGAGFRVAANSKAWANPWIVDNRFRGKLEFFRKANGGLESMEFPVTNVLLVADKV